MTAKAKILIIEDEALILQVFGDYLKKEGYEVALAPDGIEGLEQSKSFKPHLILLDIIMPKMDGITLLKKLKENPETKDIPVIILTNLESKESITKAAEAGSAEYLVKVNYSLKDLSKKVTETLKKFDKINS